jgi:NADH-quinone oxidoreductase subunit F
VSKTVSFITENFNRYDPNSIDSYLAIGGFAAVKKALSMSGAEIVELIKSASIKGRGGAAYDTGRKWEQAAAVPGENKVVICNADEGEPCTFKDRDILSKDPFRLIEGMIIAGYTAGAQNGYIYMREEYRHLRPLIKNALQEAREKGFLGKNILGTNFSFDIQLYSGAGAYVCGEGTALVKSMEGESGRPRSKPPYTKECGLFNLPTLLNNVETLAVAAAVVQHGAKDYISHGTPESKGTKMICLAGNVKKPGVYEIPFGLALREIIYDIGGGIVDDNELNFVQLGGASGKIAPASLLDTPYTYEDLAKAGLGVGSGGLLVVDKSTKVLDFLQAVQAFFIHESCGKCTPCREGNSQIACILERFRSHTPGATDLEVLQDLAKLMRVSSLCGLGQAAPSALVSAIKHFPEEFKAIKLVN